MGGLECGPAIIDSDRPAWLPSVGIKAELRVSFLQGLEALQTRASLLNRYRVLTGEPDFLARDLARYEAIDADAVKAAAASLSAERVAILRVHPEPEAQEQ